MIIESILSAMTRDEKISLLAGADMWRTVAIPRLGVPAIQMSDGPAGVRGDDDNVQATSICMPAGVALGATWNEELVREVGAALAAEARLRGVGVLLAPTVNIHRTPIAGRNFECYAEDPFLSGSIAAAYITGLQGGGVAACIKHFVANDQEHERFSISAEVDARTLREIYLEPFRIAVARAHPWSVMSAYNRINGTYASEHAELVGAVLKDEWGFDGVVISDWYGTYTDDVPAGPLDVEMPGPARWMAAAKVEAALASGALTEAALDEKARRILRLVDRVSSGTARFAGEDRGTSGAGGDTAADAAKARSATRSTPDATARRAATESMVLLKNEGALLPLDRAARQRIVVIGENAIRPQIAGGGSAFVNPHYASAPLEAIRALVGADVTVEHYLGAPIHRAPPPLETDWLRAEDGSVGLTLAYYANRDLAGAPTHVAVVPRTELSWFGTVNPYVDPANFSLRLAGSVTVPTSGEYALHLFSVGHGRLTLGGEVLIDVWEPGDRTETTATVALEAGRPTPIVLEYASNPIHAWRMARIGCEPVAAIDPVEEAVAAARTADAVVIVAGLTREWESEGFDRPDMRLVGRQDELISAVAAANARTAVVLNTGSPVEMPWVDAVPAILQSWYGGQDWGTAVADLLFGAASPSGKLPTTWPRRLEETPAFINYPGENGRVRYGEGIFVGYRYYDAKGVEPLFPFGHGLSFTTFRYGVVALSRATLTPDSVVEVTVDVTNTGDRFAYEVVQLYARDPESRLRRPPRELVAFAKVGIAAGATETVHLTVAPRDLAYFDEGGVGWITEPGEYVFEVGSSSRDIRGTAAIVYEDPEYRAPDAGRDRTQQSTVAT